MKHILFVPSEQGVALITVSNQCELSQNMSLFFTVANDSYYKAAIELVKEREEVQLLIGKNINNSLETLKCYLSTLCDVRLYIIDFDIAKDALTFFEYNKYTLDIKLVLG